MSFGPDLLDALEGCVVERVKGTVWRQVLQPTLVSRPNLRGGRWNPPDTETLYCSLDPDTAAAEIDALIAAQPIPITRQRFTYAMDVELSKVADLRPTPFSGRFDFTYDINDVAACQLIGAAAAWLGYSGLLVPSVRSSGDNLVVYVTHHGPDDYVEPLTEHPYPPGPSNANWQPLAAIEP